SGGRERRRWRGVCRGHHPGRGCPTACLGSVQSRRRRRRQQLQRRCGRCATFPDALGSAAKAPRYAADPCGDGEGAGTSPRCLFAAGDAHRPRRGGCRDGREAARGGSDKAHRHQ
ncbi:unnamed protein product, partial [Scytosiphon promiscuus]